MKRLLLALLFVPCACATAQPPHAAVPAAAGNPQVLRAGGIEARLDAPGWRPSAGPGRIEGTYFRLGEFNADGNRAFSLLLDEAPPLPLAGLLQHAVDSYSKRGVVEILEREQVAGKPACEITFVSTPVPNLRRRELYIEALMAGKWIELHYSGPEQPGALAQARAAVEPLFASLQVRPVELRAEDTRPIDVTSNELDLVAISLGCAEQQGGRNAFFCRALAAFDKGRTPAARAQPTGMAGASVIVPAPGSSHFGKSVTEASFLVLGERAATCGTLSAENEEERRAAQALVRAVTAGERLPAENPAVKAAREMTRTRPAELAERSLTWSAETHGFVRETEMGVIVLEQVEGPAWVLGVFP
jgi:hypothetical protein